MNPERFYFHAIPYIRESDYIAVVADMLRLRDKLMECAKECTECGGTGMVTLEFPTFDKKKIDDCPVCHDIRELLA